MTLLKILDLPDLGDERGGLTVIESSRLIPFKIKRLYYLVGTRINVSRGFHAHLSLDQVAICIAGSCRIVLDDGKEKAEIVLNSPLKALKLEPMVWHEMHSFSKDCILLVLASEYYDESDYVRNYNDFKMMVEYRA